MHGEGIDTYPKRDIGDSSRLQRASNEILQAHLLQGVSRTFALTIPELPPKLERVVANGYLLCRIVDTVEDEPALSWEQERYFCRLFAQVVAGREPADRFVAELVPLLSAATTSTEYELIRCTPQVIAVTHGFNAQQREALLDCVQIMSKGMAEFQRRKSIQGLADLPELDRYCYYVAGVVGEMLTKLFCEYSSRIAQHRATLMRLAVSFGQGLQMTNILKDVWEDCQRGVCWLPRDVFAECGFDLRDLDPSHHHERFGQGMARLIGIAYEHLKNALTYALLIPRDEIGIRNFCLWAIAMAVLTLRKINRHLSFTSGQQVKISRRSVRAIIATNRIIVSRDHLLRLLFYLGGIGLPTHL